MTGVSDDMTSELYLNHNTVVIVVDLTQQPAELQDGLLKLIAYAPHRNLVNENAMDEDLSEFKWHVSFVHDIMIRQGEYSCSSNLLEYGTSGDKFEIQIRYHRMIDAFRALGRLLGSTRDYMVLTGLHGDLVNFTERARFDTQGVMIDCSRGGVLRLKTVYLLLSNMALMGLNMLQLYTEDTFEIEGEPMFGYLRGRYSAEELRLIDDYAADLGIEVVPCIQTLGHMGQVLQWQRYAHLRDNAEVLLAESEQTYEFVEKMIQSVSQPLRSKRIHIGMDEAYGVGEGCYQAIFGNKDFTQIFLDHLTRVTEICINNGLQPMIWSDMIYCLAMKNNSLQTYYEESNNPASLEICKSIPRNLNLVYWDYYHTSPSLYTQKIQQHRQMGCEDPWIATGVWTWSRFWAALPFTFKAVKASVTAAKDRENGVRNTFITTWGDEGNECDVLSSLPGLFFFAQHGYNEGDEIDLQMLKRNFEGITGASFDDWVLASKIDDTPDGIPITSNQTFANNMSKWLLWEDPLLGFLSPQHAGQDLETHYSSIQEQLYKVIEGKRSSCPFNRRLELPRRVAKVLSLKCDLRKHLVKAYKEDDLERLLAIAHGRLTELRKEVDGLWKCHRSMWMETYKPFGWEVVENRYGGLRTRLETMLERIISYVATKYKLRESNSGEMDEDGTYDCDEYERLPELEAELECIYYGAQTNLLLDHARAITPSRPG